MLRRKQQQKARRELDRQQQAQAQVQAQAQAEAKAKAAAQEAQAAAEAEAAARESRNRAHVPPVPPDTFGTGGPQRNAATFAQGHGLGGGAVRRVRQAPVPDELPSARSFEELEHLVSAPHVEHQRDRADALRELCVLEPDCKWPALTLARLCDFQGTEAGAAESAARFAELARLDPARRGFYCDCCRV